MSNVTFVGVKTIQPEKTANPATAFVPEEKTGDMKIVFQPTPTARESDAGIIPAPRHVTIGKEQVSQLSAAASCMMGIPGKAMGIIVQSEKETFSISVAPEHRPTFVRQMARQASYQPAG